MLLSCAFTGPLLTPHLGSQPSQLRKGRRPTGPGPQAAPKSCQTESRAAQVRATFGAPRVKAIGTVLPFGIARCDQTAVVISDQFCQGTRNLRTSQRRFKSISFVRTFPYLCQVLTVWTHLWRIFTLFPEDLLPPLCKQPTDVDHPLPVVAGGKFPAQLSRKDPIVQ